jgi:HEAT repeat protein
MTTMFGLHFLDRTTGFEGEVFFGEIHEAFKRGITIGGFADCSLFLDHPSVDGVRAQITAGSNHRFVKVVTAPAGSPFDKAIWEFKRVDTWPFEFGEYTLRILEVDTLMAIRGPFGRDKFALPKKYLKYVETADRVAVPRLLANLIDAPPAIRLMSRKLLHRMGVSDFRPTRRGIVHRLRQYWEDPDTQVRKEAAYVLGHMRKFAAASTYLYDEDPDVRIFTAGVMRNQTLYRQEIVDVLIAVMSAEESEIDRYFPRVDRVAPILAAIGKAARPAVPVIVSHMSKPSSESCKALATIGGTEAVEALLGFLNNPNSYVRSSACTALIDVVGHADLIVPRLIQLLETETDNGVCLRAIQALARLGGGGVAAIAALRRFRDRLAALPSKPGIDWMLQETDRCFAEISK